MNVSCRKDDLVYSCKHGPIHEVDAAVLNSLVVCTKRLEARNLGEKLRYSREALQAAEREGVQGFVGLFSNRRKY